MSSIFDNDNHDNLDHTCLLHILNNIPSEHKYIYTQIWYDVLNIYLHDKNKDIRFKSYIINKFTEVAPTWALNIFSTYANLLGQHKMILIKNISRDNIQSILDNINSKLVCLEINPNEVSNIIKWYGTWEAYWNDIFNQICYSILCNGSIYSIQQLDKRDIINIADYTIYEDNIKVIKSTENIIDIYNTYRDYVYKLLELNNKGMLI